ncbi:CobW family GTP-binding protein [Sinanaerobacter sp. ZZT-01]|uniref:CobW family GTP-binding protein n=1 Tax=Sinanaerobacter sp. ZZT-01 TaxID=3111540 RepID=UPI002D79D9FE|nr:CobW family GTP-binding protein [Sinanaerobacter sp. ZZT-01]WRR92583.1 CobW family GTP-binding protein [Sinanaerobacter sp. ZZT-01]
MIKLILLTGFLGTGKTTLMKSLLKAFSQEKIGVVVNEFGEVNIDAVLVKQDGIQMAELSNGSIFCACIKDYFLDSLVEMAKQNISYLFIEASGLADPANMQQILNTISDKTKHIYDYLGSICVVDAETFLDLYELLPALHHQIEYSNTVIINKADLVDENQITQVSSQITAINAEAQQCITSFCRVDIKEMVDHLRPVLIEAKESTNTRENRPKSFVLKSIEPITQGQLQEMLQKLAPSAYRIKGFVLTDHGIVEVSAVREHIHMVPWDNETINMELEIVVISSIGIRMMSLITEAIDGSIKGKIIL